MREIGMREREREREEGNQEKTFIRKIYIININIDINIAHL